MVWTSWLGGWISLALAQVSSSPRVLWQPPDLHGYTRALQQPEASPLAPEKRYTLAELIDLAQRTNPETRVAWERARQAAAAVGLVDSEYYPVLALRASVGASRVTFPIPTDLVPQGNFRVDSAFFTPTLILATLQETKWGLAGPKGAAVRLGLNRSTLAFRMKKLGIVRPWK